MASAARVILFIVVSVVLHGGTAYYLWRRLVADTRLARPWRRLVTAVIVAGAVSMPLAMVVARLLTPAVGGLLGWPAFLWMALSGLTLLGLLITDLARLARWGGQRALSRQAPQSPARRTFLARVIGGGVASAAGGAVLYGTRRVLAGAPVVEVPVRLERLPAALDGFSLVQLSDVHIGYTIGREFIVDMVARANAAGGDAIVITGDLVDGSVATLAHAAAPLSELRAPQGVYFVTGNHEYYSGADAWIAELRRLGIRVLRNERVSLGRGTARLELAGIDDHSAARYGRGHGPDLAAAVAGRDPSVPLVLLAHQPRQVHEASRFGVDLQLSGHTHGGQIWPWHYLAKWQQGGLLAGLYRIGDTQLYVSRGTGYWGPPVRVGAPAEITRIVLRATRAT